MGRVALGYPKTGSGHWAAWAILDSIQRAPAKCQQLGRAVLPGEQGHRRDCLSQVRRGRLHHQDLDGAAHPPPRFGRRQKTCQEREGIVDPEAIEMKDGSKLHFTLIGAPDGDPGLDFSKN